MTSVGLNRRRVLKYAGATALAVGASTVGLESLTNFQNTSSAPVTVTTAFLSPPPVGYMVAVAGIAVLIVIEFLEHRKQKPSSSELPETTGPVEKAPSEQFCINCGSKLPPASKFCDKCGRKISARRRPW